MSKSKQHISQSDSEHLSLEQMQAYLDDSLPSRGMHQVERHLLDCELCSDAFEGLSAMPEPEQALDAVAHLKRNIRRKTLRQPIIRRKRKLVTVLWKPMSVAAAVLILVTAIFIFLRIDGKFRKRKDQISLSAPKPAGSSEPSAASSANEKQTPAGADQLMAQKNQLPPSDTKAEKSTVLSARKSDKSLSVFEEAEKKEEATEQTSVADQVTAPAPPIADVPPPDIAETTKPALPNVAPITEAKRAKKTDDGVTTLAAPTLSSRQASGISQSAVMITGTVVSADVEVPLAGVSVTVKGTTQGTVTDENGKFQMMMPLQSSLAFNYIGYTSGEVVVKNQEPLKVKLQEDIQALSEVAIVGYGTNNKSLEDAVLLKPQPVKGYTDYKSYLRQNLRYPEAARQKKIEGSVRVEFWVDVDSTLSEFTVKKGLGYGCDEEAIRLVKEGPAWKPATRDNQPYKRKFSVIVPFKLKEEK